MGDSNSQCFKLNGIFASPPGTPCISDTDCLYALCQHEVCFVPLLCPTNTLGAHRPLQFASFDSSLSFYVNCVICYSLSRIFRKRSVVLIVTYSPFLLSQVLRARGTVPVDTLIPQETLYPNAQFILRHALPRALVIVDSADRTVPWTLQHP